MNELPPIYPAGKEVTLRRFCYIHKTGDKEISMAISKVRIITREERAKGSMYVGQILAGRGKNLISRHADPKNPQVYFWDADILED